MVNNIEITDINIFPVKKESGKLKAYARVVLNDHFIIRGMRIYQGVNGMFVRFPQEYNVKENKSYDACFPITCEMMNYFNEEVLKQYELTFQAGKA